MISLKHTFSRELQSAVGSLYPPRILALALSVMIFQTLAPMLRAAPGDLDPLNPRLVGNYVLATAVQRDGKLILAANSIARLNADGTLDTTFNPNPNGEIDTVTFTQPSGVTGITYGAEWSTSLEGGTWQAIPDTGSGSQHIFTAPVGSNGSYFMRLKVINP